MFRKNDSPSQNEDIAGDGEWRWWGGKYSWTVQEHIYEILEKTPQPTLRTCDGSNKTRMNMTRMMRVITFVSDTCKVPDHNKDLTCSQ
jgi:hypothetical protein